MNQQGFHNSYDGSMSIPTFACDIDSEDYVVSPSRDTFQTYPAADKRVVESGSTLGQFRSFHRSRSSASTSASVSTESSPTASASLLESASTPGTSPDTPASSQSYAYPSLSSMAMRTSQENNSELRANPAPLYKKPRNLKNLAVNTSSAFPLARAVSTATFPMEVPNSPPSSSSLNFAQSFTLPPAPPRRRPSGPGLTIQTPSSDSFTHAQEVPQQPLKPLLMRPATLRQFQSSPSLPLHSALLPPEGGMRLPSFTSEFAKDPFEQEENASENYDAPESREAKPAAYPNGPICIYDPHVDLYFEPTAEEAAQYDVIFNVASEVKNPFQSEGSSLDVVPVDLKAAVEALSEQPSSPSTPRPTIQDSTAADKAKRGHPEYIHVPWEHNTDIVPGTDSIPPLRDIIRIIDSRVASGKRVLIHCQCGVSRSASLIVAYGLYKNPSITVQEAYDAVKRKSQWIGPNMNLIMQLQEFRNILLGPGKASFPQQAFPNPSSGKALHGRSTPGASSDMKNESIPQTAPLPQNLAKIAPPPVNTWNLRDVSPGPSSAPSDFHWPSHERAETVTPLAAVPYVSPDTSIVNATGHVLGGASKGGLEQPINGNKKRLAIRTGEDQKSTRASPPQGILVPKSSFFQRSQESPRASEFAMAPVRADEDNETFGITSPRPIELTSSPMFSGSPSSPHHDGAEALASPRSSEFAMTSIHQPEFDPTFGLTSPRSDTFGTQLSQAPFPRVQSRFAPLHPPETSTVDNAHARAELRSQLGLNSTRSNNDMNAQYQRLDARQKDGNQGPSRALPPVLTVSAGESDVSDALMSPRATEFTSNPFHDFLENEAKRPEVEAKGGNSDELALDPRSPPLKGASPIVRNILDVL